MYLRSSMSGRNCNNTYVVITLVFILTQIVPNLGKNVKLPVDKLKH